MRFMFHEPGRLWRSGTLMATHILDEFSCGKPSLDRWLKTRALQPGERLHGSYCRSRGKSGGRLLWACADSDRAITPSAVDPNRSTVRPCPLPAAGATDPNWIGKGIGTGLLKHALQRCVAAASLIGGRALIVNAVDVEAAAFWAPRGFLHSKDDPLILFRSIADIGAPKGREINQVKIYCKPLQQKAFYCR